MQTTAIIIPEDALGCISTDNPFFIGTALEGCSSDIVVDRDFQLNTSTDPVTPPSGDGGGSFTGELTLDASEIFAFPDVATFSTLYSLGFAVIIGPALIGYFASRIVAVLKTINS